MGNNYSSIHEYDNLIDKIGLFSDEDYEIMKYLLINENISFDKRLEAINFIRNITEVSNVIFDKSTIKNSIKIKSDKQYDYGFVYIAKQKNEENVYKIGHTKNITKREKTMYTGNLYIQIVCTLRTKYFKQVEKYLHKIYKDFHIDNEWFLFPDSVIKLIILEYGFNMEVE